MKRGLVAGVLAAILLAGMAARTTATSEAASGTAGASECSWERHAKRVVKRVKRHGKVRKVVRRRVWWNCVPEASAPAPGPIVPGPEPTPAPEPEPETNRLSVKGAEYYFVLSRPSVKAGTVTIELDNQGEDPHNLNLRLEGGDAEPLTLTETDSLQRSVATFDLPAGKYRLWCSLPEHEGKGMATSLLVQ